jgi:hypothetical protein
VLAAGVFGITACSDSLGPGNASEEERQEILSLLDESGFFADDFGLTGANDGSTAASASMALVAEPGAAEVAAPRIWGRRRGMPVSRVITVDVDRQTSIATASKEVSFEGRFLLDITADEQVNPTGKSLEETLVQYATFRRVPADQADQQGRRWRLIDISPAEWMMTAEAKRTVNLTKVEVWVNEELQLEVTDPSALLDLDTRIPQLELENYVTVRAWVENNLDNENVPDTFVFLHLFHASPNARGWLRLPMEQVEGDMGVYYERSWMVRHAGRSRISVDAIDAQAFSTDSGDDYRTSIWGIPYRINNPLAAQ